LRYETPLPLVLILILISSMNISEIMGFLVLRQAFRDESPYIMLHLNLEYGQKIFELSFSWHIICIWTK